MTEQDLRDVVCAGDRFDSLAAVRDKLAYELERSDGRESAVLAKELRAVLAEIDNLAPPKEGSKLDELAARRARRIANAEGDAPARGKRSGRPGGGRAR